MKITKICIVILAILMAGQIMPIGGTQDISPIALSNVELVTVEADSARITWVTNLPSDTRVQWGETEELGNEKVIGESRLYHMAVIQALAEGSKYHYRIGSGGRWGPIANFTTIAPPDGELELKFAIAADPHVDVDGRNNINGNMMGDGPRLLRSLVEDLNDEPDLDFLVITGDLTSGAEEDFEEFSTIMSDLGIPWYAVSGNTDKTYEGWEGWYANATGSQDLYYSFDAGGYHFVILDSSVRGKLIGEFDEEQMKWLEDDLNANEDRYTLVFMHHMADRTDEIYGLEQTSQDRLLSILSGRTQVLSISSGHIHQNIMSEIITPTNIAMAATVQYPIGYSIASLYDEGYSQSFRKIGAELQISEESRVRINTNSGSTNADAEFLGDLGERCFIVTESQNEPPEISSVMVTPKNVFPGETTVVNVDANDPDGDILLYEYEVTGGVIEGSGSSVSWTAPVQPGTYSVSVTVSDSFITVGPESRELIVELEPTEENNAPEIRSITAGKKEMELGEITVITVDADDPDDDELSYHYEVSGGVIMGDGEKVQWKAPEEAGEYEIRAWVSDGMEDSATKKITISVVDTVEDEPVKATPGFGVEFIIIVMFLLVIGYGSKKKLFSK